MRFEGDCTALNPPPQGSGRPLVGTRRESARELGLDALEDGLAEARERGDQAARLLGQEAPLRAGTADVGLNEAATQGRLGFLDPRPDMAIALPQAGRRSLDGAGPVHRLEDFADSQPEHVVAIS